TAADTMAESGWQARPASAMACLDRSVADWTEFIAANFLVDTALTTLFEAATDSPYQPLCQRARKILQEEAAHWVHAEGWIRRLAADETRRPDLSRDLANFWDDAFTWFGRGDDQLFAQLGRASLITSHPDTLRDRLSGRLAPL